MLFRKYTTWILIADGARAHIIANDGPGKGLKPVPGREYTGVNLPTREIGMKAKVSRVFMPTSHAQGWRDIIHIAGAIPRRLRVHGTERGKRFLRRRSGEND